MTRLLIDRALLERLRHHNAHGENCDCTDCVDTNGALASAPHECFCVTCGDEIGPLRLAFAGAPGDFDEEEKP